MVFYGIISKDMFLLKASAMSPMAPINFLLTLLSIFALLCFVSTQNPYGFISLDCGLIPADARYEEPKTGIIYDSDAAFIDSGTVHNISSHSVKSNNQQPLWSLRSFPKGTRNCYKVRVKFDTKYLIRASFLYGDYDGQKHLPSFDLHVGPNLWTSIDFGAIDTPKHLEIIHVVSSNYAQICLINTGAGTPFISALELRPLNNASYPIPPTSPSISLANFFRFDVGSATHQTYRYKDDVYDRIWVPMDPVPVGWSSITSSEPISFNELTSFSASAEIVNSAATPSNALAPLEFHCSISPTNATEFWVYMYFSEIQNLKSKEFREFEILVNEKLWATKFSPPYLGVQVVYNIQPISSTMFNFSIIKTPNSTLPPILNAIELYTVVKLLLSETNPQDVEAIWNIKKVYGIERNWQGDPCAPTSFIWEGLKCDSLDSQSPRITVLDLSSSGLTGEIAKDMANLIMLQTLDLSNNDLSGTVPEFLAQLPSLKVLNLERNKLSGLVPSQLIEKSSDTSLSLRLDENPNLSMTAPSEEKKQNTIIVPVVASISGFVLLILFSSFSVVLWIKITKQRKKQGEAGVIARTKQNVDEYQSQQCYSYSDILRMTNNFEQLLGQGGFGKVYYGHIGNIEVAVKMLSPQSVHGFQQFQAEVDILMRVHHKNLTGLVGYCNESTHKALIYEYMERGNLGSLISGGRSPEVLNWKERLLIAVDAAHGLEYLHYGIKPAIIHRDVKSTNILLDNNFRAKLSDFGLSRIFPTEDDATHVTTNVVGTYGYIDPEYHSSGRLNEKSDVYGFGVVLLEIITGKPALIKSEDQVTHVYQWVGPLLSQGDIRSIIDPKMQEDLDVNSIWKAVDIAMCCASKRCVDRPNMNQVVVELNECLAMELARHNHDGQSETIVADSSILFGPFPR